MLAEIPARAMSLSAAEAMTGMIGCARVGSTGKLDGLPLVDALIRDRSRMIPRRNAVQLVS
jgi:hypothetical protein